MELNYNDYAEKAHQNAVNHGFWENELSNEHYLMLIVTEIAEAVEADRTGHKCEIDTINAFELSDEDFEANVKDTVEDEMADVAIRLFDLAGALGIDFDKMAVCRYCRSYDNYTFTENAFGLVKGLARSTIAIQKRILFALDYLCDWSAHYGVDLEWHINAKMRYNENRSHLHGKEY